MTTCSGGECSDPTATRYGSVAVADFELCFPCFRQWVQGGDATKLCASLPRAPSAQARARGAAAGNVGRKAGQ